MLQALAAPLVLAGHLVPPAFAVPLVALAPEAWLVQLALEVLRVRRALSAPLGLQERRVPEELRALWELLVSEASPEPEELRVLLEQPDPEALLAAEVLLARWEPLV